MASDLRQALLEHQVIFLRDQQLSPAQFLEFASHMGEPVEYPFVKGLDGYPHIIEVKKLEHERSNFGGIWHSDTTYLEEPPMGSMLLAREVPPYGGDTLFANQYLAYETLSDTMKRLLDGLVGISSSAKADVSKTREDRIRTDGKTSEAAAGLRRRASGGAHPSRNRPQVPLRQRRPHQRHQGHDRRRRASRSWTSCSRTRSSRSSPAGSAGSRARSRSGTTAAPSTIRSTTTTAFAA